MADGTSSISVRNVESLIKHVHSESVELCGWGQQDHATSTEAYRECAQLAIALSTNRALSSLTLSGVPSRLLIVSAEALKINTTLTSLHVWGGELDDATGTALAEALKINTTLTSLHVGGGELDDVTGTALAEALKINTTLTSLHVEGGELDDVTGTALVEALKINTTLTSLHVEGGELDHAHDLRETLQQSMERNQAALICCRTLARLARPDFHSIGFTKLTSIRFKHEIFQFFLLPGCVPAQAFVDMGMVAGCVQRLDNAMAVDATSSDFISEPRPCDVQSRGTLAGSSMEPGQETPESSHPSDEPAVVVAASAAAAAEKEDNEKLGLAIQESLAEAVGRANSDLAVALSSSKADSPPCFNADGVVLLRLTCHARAAAVANALRTSPALAACRAVVEDAGCELQPEWANGTWILLPLTREIYEEAALETSSIHILALSGDECAVREALKMVRYQKRPKLKAVDTLERTSQDATAGSSNSCGDPRDRTTYAEDDNVDIVVKCTFLECRPRMEDNSGPWSEP